MYPGLVSFKSLLAIYLYIYTYTEHWKLNYHGYIAKNVFYRFNVSCTLLFYLLPDQNNFSMFQIKICDSITYSFK